MKLKPPHRPLETNAASSDEALRARLRALDPPPPDAALRDAVLAQAAARLPARTPWWRPLWRPALACGILLVAGLIGFNEYQSWRELQQLAELDTLSAATLLLL